MGGPSAEFLAAIERNRRRVWTVCYRMTGRQVDADDLAQEALARAIERCHQVTERDPSGWLLRLTMRVCLDHLRHRKIERRVTELVDPLEGVEWSLVESPTRAPDFAAILREDTRFAVVVALQRLSAGQRAALILHDVCARPMEEVAEVLHTNPNAAKALLHRGRVALRESRLRDDVDVPVDREVVEKLAGAIEAGSVEALTALLTEDVWGIVDGGGVVQASKKPTFGVRAVSRQWENGKRRLGGQRVRAGIVLLNGEPSIVIRLAETPGSVVAVVHLQSRAGHVSALCVDRDPRRTSRFS